MLVNTLTYPVTSEHRTMGGAVSAQRLTDSREEASLVERLRNRDEAAFLEVVQKYHGSLLRVAQTFVSNRAVAEEVVQETWVAVLQGVDRFQGRSSLKTWIFQILINRSKTRGVREARTINFSSLSNSDSEAGFSPVDPNRFHSSDDCGQPGTWASQPQQWDMTPEQLLLSQECRLVIEEAIANLPLVQRQVITLKDVQGWDNQEICTTLDISEPNCRVLLHRSRSRVRQALEGYLGARKLRDAAV
jgi:RNA polymerase sigma-70 factor (ECF subfamily)